jgi:hypothetical protein
MRFTKLMPGYRQMAAALPLVILFSCGAAPGSITQRSHAPVAFACPSPRPINEFGMTDEQRMEHHKWLTAHWEECYTRWESGIDYAALKWSTLPHADWHADFGPLPDSLSKTKASATLIVSGTALSLNRGRNGPWLDATLSVTRVFKGQANKTIVINQAARLWPQDNWQTIAISAERSTPVLLPGDSVFLFLEASSRGLYAQPFTGTYFVRDGRIQAMELSRFASKVNGLSPAEFAAAITAG